MHWRSSASGLAFSFVFVLSVFTNKFVLSVLKFTYPTLFQGWQTLVSAALLLLSAKLGWLEVNRVSRSAALSWLPGSLLFVGSIYSGSRALSRIDIPFFFTLQNSSYVVSYIFSRLLHREKTSWVKVFSISLLLLAAISLPLCDPQFDSSAYMWALSHTLCSGAYRVFHVHHKSSNLSEIEQQCINYFFSVLLLGLAAHPTGDLFGALDFPSLHSYTFHCGCCASALLGFFLLLATVRLNRGLSPEHFRVWTFLSKVTAMALSPLLFNMDVSAVSAFCVAVSLVGEALLVSSDKDSST